MSRAIRSGGQVGTSRRGGVGRLRGIAVVVGLVAAAGVGIGGVPPEAHVPQGVHLLAATGSGDLTTTTDPVPPPRCCSGEGPTTGSAPAPDLGSRALETATGSPESDCCSGEGPTTTPPARSGA
jgi:hypothetical protein